jgi:hypothetical protein
LLDWEQLSNEAAGDVLAQWRDWEAQLQ